MAGRQIRWQSVGRIAAAALAVIAAVAALPSLLGSDSPPPVPDDVGLVPPPSTPVAVPAEIPADPPAPSRRSAPLNRRGGRSKGDFTGEEGGNRTRDRRRRRNRSRGERTRGKPSIGATSEDAVSSTPAYVPSYSPPPSREFQIEP